MNEVRYLQIKEEEVGQRLDNYLIRILKGVPKSYIYRIIRGGEVRVNKKRAQPSTKLAIGDMIRIPPVRSASQKPILVSEQFEKRLKDCIIYEDEALLVLNKPAGIAVHGGSGVSLGIVEGLRKIRTDLHYIELVHRLDRDTSGCLLLAKKRSMLRAIQALLEERQINKIYWAILEHSWEEEKTLWINKPLQKNTLKSGERMVCVSEEGKPSSTRFTLLENYQQTCLVEAFPKTGRTHQIRVHSAYMGHAILGDEKYSQEDLIKKIALKPRLYLHARAINFQLNGKNYSFEADLDITFSETLKQLKIGSSLS